MFEALANTIPRGHPLYPLLNRHTVKVSYSTMPNLQKKVNNHNKKILEEEEEEERQQQQQQQQDAQQQQQGRQNIRRDRRRRARARNPNCNCQAGPQSCPLRGRCLSEKDIVYVAQVTRLDNFDQERYTGVHEGPFKSRYYGHKGNIRNRNQKGTRLSRHIWTLKDNQPHPVPFELEWGILGKEKPFNPVTGVCRLCLLEAYILMFDDVNTTLNVRGEYWSSCPHRRKYLLSNN